MDAWTVVAAWWGAFIATVVLLFEYYKYTRCGPRIRCDAKYGWKIMMEGTQDDNKYIFFTVTNIGDRPTTITGQAVMHWPTRIKKAFCKSGNQFIVKGGLHGFGKVPAVIPPGEIWNGLARINEDIEGLMNNEGYLYLSLSFSHRRRPLFFMVAKGSG